MAETWQLRPSLPLSISEPNFIFEVLLLFCLSPCVRCLTLFHSVSIFFFVFAIFMHCCLRGRLVLQKNKMKLDLCFRSTQNRDTGFDSKFWFRCPTANRVLTYCVFLLSSSLRFLLVFLSALFFSPCKSTKERNARNDTMAEGRFFRVED